MRIPLGFNDYLRKQGKDVPVFWDSDDLINPHIILCAKSGMGKSYQLMRFIREGLASAGDEFERYHNLDVHGDLVIPGESRVEFSRATRYGYNPLVLDPNPKSGGVERQINFILQTINQTSRKIMDKQEACLRNVLTDVYAIFGIYETEPATWRREEITERERNERWTRDFRELMARYYPTLDDAIAFAERKLRAMYGGLNANEDGSRAVNALEEMNRTAASLNRLVNTKLRKVDDEEREKAAKSLEAAKEKYLERVMDYMKTIETGREYDDLIKYDSKDVLKSVIDRLKNFRAIGIFNANPPPFDPSAKIWSYDLTNIDEGEKYIFAKIRAQYIMRMRKLAGATPHLKEVIGADEAHNLFDDDPDSIYNKIAKEARKFGLGLWAVSQTPSDFPQGVITTVATKILLGIDSSFWAASCKKLNIEESVLKFITPQKTIAVYMDKKGSTNAKFNTVVLQ
ncbi:helicase HerA-like domain-containing protein [Paraburkholderia sp. BR10872]|uniref:helicase HerA-like domain-containing protein n=1 Tax=Paraburkholderia sp. BR10872 TaxID=3236989 RepID=UPI0034D2B000